jgi:hypothetical protein
MKMRSEAWILVMTGGLCPLILVQANQGDIIWQGVGAGGGGGFVSTPAIDPSNTTIVLVGSDTGGIYRTADGGLTWTNANTGAITAPTGDAGWYAVETFAFAPSDPNRVYAGALHGVLRSSDRGITWTAGPFLKLTGVVAVDPTDPARVYAGSGSVYFDAVGCVFLSYDGAQSFTPIPFADPNADPSVYCFEDNANKPIVTSILISSAGTPAARIVLMATSKGLYRSDNSGLAWSKVGSGLPHEDCGTLAFDPQSNTAYLTMLTHTDEPLYGSEFVDGYIDPSSWQGGVYSNNAWSNPNSTWQETNGIDGDDFMLNGSFEIAGGGVAAGWTRVYDPTGTLVRRVSIPTSDPEDQYAIEITTPDYSQGGPGIISARFSVTAGERYEISALAKANQLAYDPSDCCARSFFARLYFYDASGAQMDPSRCSPSHTNLWASRDMTYAWGTPTQWRRYEAVFQAPQGAAQAAVQLYTSATQGRTRIDHVQVRQSNSLPRTDHLSSVSSSYRALAADPIDPNTLYVGTFSSNASEDVGGIWKSVRVNGALKWVHETRAVHLDNVLDKRANADPADPNDPNDEAGCWTGYGYVPVYGLGIGSGAAGHDTLHFTTPFWFYRKAAGSWQWENTTHDEDPNAPSRTAWKSRGVTNNIISYVAKSRGAKVFSGDDDNALQISHNRGDSFRQEGIVNGYFVWGNPLGLNTQASAVTSVEIDPNDDDHVFVAGWPQDGTANVGGILEGCFTCDPNTCVDPGLCGNPSTCGDPSSCGQGATPAWAWGAIGPDSLLDAETHLIQLPGQQGTTLYAAIGGRGVYRKLLTPGSTWEVAEAPYQDWPDHPNIFRPNQIAADAARRRVFVALGERWLGADPNDTGIWMLDPNEPTWCRITPSSQPPYGEPVLAMRVGASGEMYAGTSRTTMSDGGLYKGAQSGTACSWTWTEQSIHQPRVTGVAVSPLNPQILYAVSAQQNNAAGGQVAGIYKSIDSGTTWSLLDQNGLMNLKDPILDYGTDGIGNLTMYVATYGSGVFKGTILPPAVPTGLTGSPAGFHMATLSWEDNSKAELGYRIERKKRVNGTWSQIIQLPANTVTHTDTTPTGGNYYYRVRAFDEAGNSAYSNEVLVVVQG